MRKLLTAPGSGMPVPGIEDAVMIGSIYIDGMLVTPVSESKVPADLAMAYRDPVEGKGQLLDSYV